MDKDNNLANMNIFENNDYSRPKNIEKNYVVDFAMPKDAISQFSEGLFNLQTEIDTLKKQTSTVINNNGKEIETLSNSENILNLQKEIEELKQKMSRLSDGVIEKTNQSANEVKEEIKGMTNSFRGDIYDMNDKLEEMGRVISDRVLASLSEEIKEILLGDDSLINSQAAKILQSIEKKIDEKFSEILTSIAKNQNAETTQEEYQKENYYNKILDKIEVVEQKLAMMERVENNEEKGVVNENDFNILISQKEEEIEKLTKSLNYANEQIQSLTNEKANSDSEENCGEEKTDLSSINEKLDEIKNYQRNIVIANDNFDVNSIENIVAQKNDDLLQSLDDKYQLINSEFDYIKSKIVDKKQNCVEDSEDRIMLMLEKIYNQVSNLLEDNRSEIDNIRSEIDRFKKNFTTVTEGAQVSDGKDELQDSLDGLKEELDNLSKLVTSQTNESQNANEKENEEISSNIMDVTCNIENLTKEIIKGEN